MLKKTLTNCTEYQIESLLRDLQKNIIRASQEQLTINEIIKDLAWPPRDKAFNEVTNDIRSSSTGWVHPHKQELEFEIMLREQTVELLNHDIALANRFLKEAKLILDDLDYQMLELLSEGNSLFKIGIKVNYVKSVVYERVKRSIIIVQSKLRTHSV